MLNRNYYKSITESIVKAYRDNNLDSAVEQGEDMDNMGKKIVAIITADPDQDLDWSSEYQPFGATEIEYDDECDGEDCENDTCPSCGTDVDGHIVSDDEDDDSEENDDMEDIMIGGGFEDMDVKDILIDILNELRGEDGEENEDDFETSDDNPMFGGSDDEESDDEWEDEDDDDSMLVPQDDWSSDESDDDDEQDDKFDGEEDNESFADENGVEMEDVEGMLTASQDEEEVEILDCLDNA